MNRLFIISILIIIILPVFPLKADENQPPSITIITGVTNGKLNTFYNYTFYATDPDNDEISYLIHWGDGMVFYWMGPYNSGEKITISYRFQLMSNQRYDELIISARAKDMHNICGEWGHLHVSVLKNNYITYNTDKFSFENNFLMNLLDRYLYKISTLSHN